jgi:RNA polymerase sigma factor (sigma-70 family)
VLQACGDSPAARAALSDLCAAYYAPVMAFIRLHSPNEETTRELTQEFFARLLARESLGEIDPHRSRFRSYLLGAVKHFLLDMRKHAQRLKRGGGVAIESIDDGTDISPGFQVADPNIASPDREFDRKWALTLLDRALRALAAEHNADGKSSHFEALKPWLTGDNEDASQADIAHALGMNEGAVKVAIHRLRRRFRQFIKSEIAETVQHRTQVEEELHHLLQALTQ